MATLTIEALKTGEDTDALVSSLRRVVSGNPFRGEGPGRWKVELSDSKSGDQAREVIESQLDELDESRDWRQHLRVIASDGGN
jgi:hypothetical protein